jgi:hypothetical protein
MKRQQKTSTERRIEAIADDFTIRLSLANAKVLRAAMDRPKRRKRKTKPTTGHAAS